MVDISILIVTYNPGELITQCLQLIPIQAGKYVLETIVIDNASQDGTPELVARDFPHVKLIACDDNPGFGVANNRGFAQAQGRYIVVLNPDVSLRVGALENMIDYLEAHEDVGVVGPRTFDENGTISRTARHRYTVLRLLSKYLGLNYFLPSLVYGQYGAQSFTATEPFEVDWLHGSALAIRRDIYSHIKGFDEGFFLFMEDVDLCIRIKDSGWRVIYLPLAEVEHLGSATVKHYPVARIRSYHISPLYYFRKRNKELAVIILKCGFTVELLAKCGIRWLQNRFDFDEGRAEKLRVEWAVIGDVWRF